MTPGKENDANGWCKVATIALVCALVTGAAVSTAAGTATDPEATGDESGESALSIVQDDGVNQTKFVGGASGDRLGQSVAAAGDVNGDGAADLLIGSPSNDSGGPNAGAVYLFYGPLEQNIQNVSAADATFVGETEGDRAGIALAAGDVNGDGFSDIVVGAPRHDDGAGAVYVVYGGDALDGRTSLSDADAKLVGETAGSLAGFSVAMRDVDSAEERAIVVGAPTNASASRPGSAYLLSSDSLSQETSLSEADVKLVGEAEGDLAGWSVAWAGDVTNDSVVDVILGAPAHDSSLGEDAGSAYVVGSDIEGVSSMADVSSAKLDGTNESDNLGFSVGGPGDVDGDGVDDLLVGAPSNDRRGTNAGAAYLFFGSESLTGTIDAADAPVDIFGETPGDRFGWSVAGVDDVDCDDRADVVVGAPYQNSTANDAGAAYLMFGSSVSDSVSVAKLSGESEDDLAGFGVGGAGDVTGDSGDDVLIGAPFTEEPEGGAAYLISSECSESNGG